MRAGSEQRDERSTPASHWAAQPSAARLRAPLPRTDLALGVPGRVGRSGGDRHVDRGQSGTLPACAVVSRYTDRRDGPCVQGAGTLSSGACLYAGIGGSTSSTLCCGRQEWRCEEGATEPPTIWNKRTRRGQSLPRLAGRNEQAVHMSRTHAQRCGLLSSRTITIALLGSVNVVNSSQKITLRQP
jgi:hypothetical protein